MASEDRFEKYKNIYPMLYDFNLEWKKHKSKSNRNELLDSTNKRLKRAGSKFYFEKFKVLVQKNSAVIKIANFLVIPFENSIIEVKEVIEAEIFLKKDHIDNINWERMKHSADEKYYFRWFDGHIILRLPLTEYSRLSWVDTFLDISPNSKIKDKELFRKYIKDSLTLMGPVKYEVFTGNLWKTEYETDGQFLKLHLPSEVHESLLATGCSGIDTIRKVLAENDFGMCIIWAYMLLCQSNSLLFKSQKHPKLLLNVVTEKTSNIIELLDAMCKCVNIVCEKTDFIGSRFTMFELNRVVTDDFKRYSDRAMIYDGLTDNDFCLEMYEKLLHHLGNKPFPHRENQISPIFVTTSRIENYRFINVDLKSCPISSEITNALQKSYREILSNTYLYLKSLEMWSDKGEPFSEFVKKTLYQLSMKAGGPPFTASAELSDFVACLHLFYSTYSRVIDNGNDGFPVFSYEQAFDVLLTYNKHHERKSLEPDISVEDTITIDRLLKNILMKYNRNEFEDYSGLKEKPISALGFLLEDSKSKRKLICFNDEKLDRFVIDARKILDQAFESREYRFLFAGNSDNTAYGKKRKVNVAGESKNLYALWVDQLEKLCYH